MDYIGISDDRLHHIVGVARKAYMIALDMGFDEDFARKMFVLGWNHDIGYEFCNKQEEHNRCSAELFGLIDDIRPDNKCYRAIRFHSLYPDCETVEWKILTVADMLVDSKGRSVDVLQRLEDIKIRYGERSDQYLTCCDVCYKVGLIAINPAALG